MTIDGVVLRPLSLLSDDRGSFSEAFRSEWFPGVPGFVQGNLSRSRRGVVRGLHYHLRQFDLWVPLAGWLFVGLHDLRAGSPTAGETQTFTLAADEPDVVLIPPGVAHGFQALEDAALLYLVSEAYDGTDELGFRYDDPGAAVPWPLPEVVVSDRDRDAPPLAAVVDRPTYR